LAAPQLLLRTLRASSTMQTNTTLAFTGERFLPEISGNIELEHMHRYIYALAYAQGKTVLDVASGEGYGTALLASHAAFITGVDIAEDAVAHARRKYQLPNLEFRLGSCSKIPLMDGTVDLVVSYETIEHHDEHEQMLAEIKRVLKPNGMVIVSSPDKAIYTDKPDYHNRFHVKELYREEFEALFRTRFKNVVSLGQKVMFGSGIIPDGEGTQTAFTSVDLGGTTSRPGLVEAMYNLIMASDAALPAAPSSFLDVGIDASENIWKAAVAQRDGDIQRLQGKLAEQSAQIAEYLHHLDRINAWGWFRLGLFLDRLIRAPLRLFGHRRTNVIADERSSSIASTHTETDNFGTSLPKFEAEAATPSVAGELLSYQPKMSLSACEPEHASANSKFISSKSQIALLDASTAKVAIIIHAYYLDVFKAIIKSLGDVDVRHKIFITTLPSNAAGVNSVMERTKFDYEIFVCENRGRDVLPFLSVMNNIDLDSYPFILKLHTKKSPHREDGDKWCRDMCSCLGRPEQLDWILRQMCAAANIGLVGPQDHVISMGMYYGENRKNVNWLASRMGIENIDPNHDRFIAGTMFVARSDALKPILALGLRPDEFEPELSQLDGTMAHAVERALAYSAMSAGFEIASVARDGAASHEALRASSNVNYGFADPTPMDPEGGTKKFSFKNLIRLVTGARSK